MSDALWFDVRDTLPEHFTEWWVATDDQEIWKATYMKTESAGLTGYWVHDNIRIRGVTHYGPLPDLPPPPRPRGPFKLIESPTGLALLYGNKTHGIAWWTDDTMRELVDWLNEMVAKREASE